MTRASFEEFLTSAREGEEGGWWKSLEELAGDAEADAVLRQEWPRLASLAPEVDRRTLMKLVGANLAALGLGACDETPEEAVGYVERPEEAVAGAPRYYATALTLSGYAAGVLAETRSGRPIRIQGNPSDPVSRGASSTFAQAAVYDLYDPDRLRAPRHRGEASDWNRFLAAVMELRARASRNGGAGLRLLTGRVTSPSLAAQIAGLKREFPQMRWHVWEPVSRDGVAEGARIAFGREAEPLWHLEEARRIVSFDADFFSAEEPGHLAHARGFAAARRTGGEHPPARLYVAESTPGLAGAKADHRLAASHGEIEGLARGLAARLGLDVAAPATGEREAAWLDALAADLDAHRGTSLVAAGIRQPPRVHALVHALNERLGNTGRTVTYIEPVAAQPDGGIAELADAIETGDAKTLIVLGGNPFHDAPADLDLERRLAALHTVYCGTDDNETAAAAAWALPLSHELESWGDARAHDGTTYLRQPPVRPLYGSRSEMELLAILSGDMEPDGRKLLREYWTGALPELRDETAWRRALQKGVLEEGKPQPLDLSLRADALHGFGEARDAASKLTVQFRPHPALWDGRFANNGWLQELPEMLTKLVWGNAVLMAPSFAEARGIEAGDVVRLEAGGRHVEGPAWSMPGHPENSITVHLGFGRKRAGALGSGVGWDAYPLRTSSALWALDDATLTRTGETAELVTTQQHHSMEGRDIIRRAAWNAAAEEAGKPPQLSLYPEPAPKDRSAPADAEPPLYQWGMVIDFDACTGCNACVTACQSENNVPIVGKEEVARGREMHWLRIDRYYSGPPENPETALQPVPCMHCENAPCEYVCPVEATQHSDEGLNEMIYNRCIGTRYCSQNCPYKVRRFNWFDYTGRDAEMPFLEALQNPDVTVRSRGVMEKCTYCVQRINRARIAAEREGREIADGEIVTACQEACPSGAIVFGNIADPESAVAKLKQDPRNYGLLEELNTRPRTTYLAAVRNPDPALGKSHGKGAKS